MSKSTENKTVGRITENDSLESDRLEEKVRRILEARTASGTIKSREGNRLEFKKSYNKGDLPKYARTMAAYANNVGGYIIYGIADSPRTVIGLKNDNFENLKQEEITDFINSMFSPMIDWDMGTIALNGGTESDGCSSKQIKVGWIYAYESETKPVIALKDNSDAKISAGDVFFRYHARSGKIKPAEMERIVSERIKRERDGLFRVLESIRKSGTANIGIVNYSNGTFSTPYGVDLAVDRKIIANLLRKVKFIKEGSFSEKDGAPAIKVIGDIDLVKDAPKPEGNPDEMYPYIQAEMAKKLNISQYYVHALVWHFHIKDSKEFHMAITLSKSGSQRHKFSEAALEFLRKKWSELSADKTEFDRIKAAFNSIRAGKKKKRAKPKK